MSSLRALVSLPAMSSLLAMVSIAILALLLVRSFATYWLHRLLHVWRLLWRIHKVHHADTAIDCTTGLRNHPFEALATTTLAVAIVIALGPSLVNVAKIGRSESRSEVDTIKLKECRIVYRRTGQLEKSRGYASAAGLNPTRYIDPNDPERQKAEKAAEPELHQGETL